MAKLLIVNPSVNTKLAAIEMKMYGNSVDFAYTQDIPHSNAERVFYFLSGVNICFTTEPQGEMEREDRVFLFKHNIFSKFKMMGYKKNMESLYPDLVSGNFTDMLMFKRSVLRFEQQNITDNKLQYDTYKEMLLDNRNSHIITSCVFGIGNESAVVWETDFDLQSTFNNDYFVFFTENIRIETYVSDNKLITLGKGNAEQHLAGLQSIIPVLSKFSFNKISENHIMRNFKPWVNSLSGIKGYLINDYSFGRLSVSMPSAWYDKIASFINDHTFKNSNA